MADSLFDIFSTQQSEPPKMDIDSQPKTDEVVAVAPAAEEPKCPEVVVPVAVDVPVPVAVDAPVTVAAGKVPDPVASEDQKPAAEAPKKKRAPKKQEEAKPKATAKKPKPSSSSSSKKVPPAKAKKDKTKKEAAKKKCKKEKDLDRPTFPEGRNPPGYSMLKTESDKLDRIVAGLIRKKENRIASGKPTPSVCGMFNDNLLKFFKRVRADFDEEFEEYMC